MTQNHIDFTFVGRYFQLGELNDHTRHLLFVLHGYGQQARYFLRKFRTVENAETCIIAPEGLARFYLSGFKGRVGATWMTKEDRLTDIQNYLSYLTAIFDHLAVNQKDLKITILGFSQGAATASRWALSNNMRFDRLILWAGLFPPDMDFDKASVKLEGKPVHYVYGTNDALLTADALRKMKLLSEKAGITPLITTFEGGHDIHEETLHEIIGQNLS